MNVPAPRERSSAGASSARPKTELSLPLRDRIALLVQRELGRVTALVWVPLAVAVMHIGYGWRIRDLQATRAAFRAARREGGPLLVCANHLTMVDSLVVAWALAGPLTHLVRFSGLPWNLPERANFAASPLARVLAFFSKCLPISRGTDRRESARVVARAAWLVARGEAVLVFPEGGRSRTGRVDPENAAHGVGRLVGQVEGCRIFCIYLRGESQVEMSSLPARGETFRVRTELIEPRSAARGVRRSLDLASQIVYRLAELERMNLEEMR